MRAGRFRSQFFVKSAHYRRDTPTMGQAEISCDLCQGNSVVAAPDIHGPWPFVAPSSGCPCREPFSRHRPHLKMPHSALKVAVRCLQQQMIADVHDAVGVGLYLKHTLQISQQTHEALPVVVTFENVSIACITVHRMIPGARILDSQWSGHIRQNNTPYINSQT